MSFQNGELSWRKEQAESKINRNWLNEAFNAYLDALDFLHALFMPCKTFRNLILLISFFFVLLSPQHDQSNRHRLPYRDRSDQISVFWCFCQSDNSSFGGRSNEQLCLVIRAEIPVYIMSVLVTIANNNVFFITQNSLCLPKTLSFQIHRKRLHDSFFCRWRGCL